MCTSDPSSLLDQLSLVVEHTPDVLYALTVPDGLVTFIGPQVRHWGLAPEQVIGRPFTDFIAPEALEGVRAHCTGRATGRARYQRFTLVTPDGRRIPVEEAGNIVRRAGRAAQYAGVLREISGQLSADAELQRYRDRLEELVAERTAALQRAESAARRHAEELHILSHAAGVLIERMSDIELAEFIAGQIRLLTGAACCTVSAFEAEAHAVILQALSADAATLRVAAALLPPLAGMRFIVDDATYARIRAGELARLPGGLAEITFGQLPASICDTLTRELQLGDTWGLPIIDGGEVLGLITLCLRTGQALANPALITAFVNQASVAMRRNRAEAALERERATLAAAVDMLPLPLWLLDTAGNMQVNPAGQAFRRRTNLAQRREVAYLDPATRLPLPQEQRTILRALRGEVIVGRELLLLTGDGDALPVITHAAPIRLNGEIVGAVGVIEDITPLKEADRAKDEFLATLSHELQTPLTSILSWTELARGTRELDILTQAIEVIYLNAQRQKALIAEMLDMSRLLYRKLTLEPHLLDLGYEAQLAVTAFKRQAEERHLTLALVPCDHPLPVMADPLRLQQCIGNLLQNSLKFTPANGCVVVSCVDADGIVELTVTDTGCGLTPEMLATIFTPFRQVNRDVRRGGLGLGLALVRGIIELHGGRVAAESPGLGEGCTVRIRLPRYAAP